jgi:hypothetical protein
MVEMKPEKDGNFIKRAMDEKQANKKNHNLVDQKLKI